MLETGTAEVATACPYCLVMLRDGLADAGDRAAGVQARDIAEILAGSVEAGPAEVDTLAP